MKGCKIRSVRDQGVSDLSDITANGLLPHRRKTASCCQLVIIRYDHRVAQSSFSSGLDNLSYKICSFPAEVLTVTVYYSLYNDIWVNIFMFNCSLASIKQITNSKNP